MTSAYDLASTTAVILAGGLGTRLRPVVTDRPKVLAPVGGRPFLAYLLDQVATSGIRRAVLCTGHLGEQIESAFGRTWEGVELTYSRETEPLGTGGALRLALDQIDSSSLLLMNGDSYCDADLLDLWDWHHVHPAHVTVVTTEVEDVTSFGRVDIDANDRIQCFAEKGPGGPGRINAGLYLMHTALIHRIPADRTISIENELFPRWVDDGGVFAYPTGGRFHDIGTPERLARAETFVRALRPENERTNAIDEIASAFHSVEQGEPA